MVLRVLSQRMQKRLPFLLPIHFMLPSGKPAKYPLAWIVTILSDLKPVFNKNSYFSKCEAFGLLVKDVR